MNKETIDILVLGGTQMVGRDFVEFCIDQGIQPTIANRGITNKNLFPNLKHIVIDRNNIDSCQNLEGLHFDIVVDFSCYNINQLINPLKYISYKKYIIISTLCVFNNKILEDKNDWLHEYCSNKKMVEQYIKNKYLEKFIVVRPCVLYGRNDYTNRFYEKNNKIYWKYNNQEVKEDKYYIPIRKFTNLLYKYININDTLIKNINIDNDGAFETNEYS